MNYMKKDTNKNRCLIIAGVSLQYSRTSYIRRLAINDITVVTWPKRNVPAKCVRFRLLAFVTFVSVAIKSFAKSQLIFVETSLTRNQYSFKSKAYASSARNFFFKIIPVQNFVNTVADTHYTMINCRRPTSSSSYLFIYQETSYHKKKLQLPQGLSAKHRNKQFLQNQHTNLLSQSDT